MVSESLRSNWSWMQPKEIKDLKEFIRMMRREKNSLPKAEKITIKKNKKTAITKFKLRTPKYLIALKVDDTTKAEKIMQSIPPNLKKEQLNVNSKWVSLYWVLCRGRTTHD